MPSSSIGGFDEHDELYPGHRWHAVMHGIVASSPRARPTRVWTGPTPPIRMPPDSIAHAASPGLWASMASSAFIPASWPPPTPHLALQPEEVAHAEQVVKAYDEAAAAGRGAGSLNGKMIDAANVRMARMVLENWRATHE